MAEPNNNITATRKNFVSNDNEGRMVEKCIIEIQGTFLEKILHSKILPPFYHNDDEEIEEEEDPNETDNAPEIFMIEGNLFDFETPLCKAFNEFNYLLKIDIDLFTYNIQNFKTYHEYKQEGTDESWNGSGRKHDLQDHSWYDELADGKLKDETLALKTKIEGSWGDATPGIIKFCRWLKSCFENFHELEYEVLVKLQDCWWKVNTHKIAPFTRMENFGRGPYANMKTEWGNNPHLDTNHIFERDHEA
ncbi:hypothetical protein Tco_0290422 [Tanacetum coccineum]